MSNNQPKGVVFKDDNKMAHKLMQKMGWTEGKGLGLTGSGNIEPIKVKLKSDNRGVGCSKNYANNWIAHQDDFNSLLANLNTDDASTKVTGYGSDPEARKVQKLEEKGRNSKGRVHYMKFAKGKDLSAKSSEEMDCIFGTRTTKSAPVTPQGQSKANSEDDEAAAEERTQKMEQEMGVNTFSSGTSVSDYFAQKMAALKKSREGGHPPQNSDPRAESEEDQPRAGFGLSSAYTPADMGFNSAVNTSNNSDPEAEDSNEQTNNETKKKKKKKDKKEKQEEKLVEESKEASSEGNCSEEESRKKKKKKKKSKDAQEEVEEVSEEKTEEEDDEPKKKKKKKRRVKDQEEEAADVIEQDSEKEKKKAKEQEDVVEEVAEQTPKKKKKSKKRKAESEEDEASGSPKDEEELPSKKRKIKGAKNAEEAQAIGEIRKVVDTMRKPKAALNAIVKAKNFKGSNFDDIKGYGHTMDSKLTLMPISVTRKMKLKQSLEKKTVDDS